MHEVQICYIAPFLYNRLDYVYVVTRKVIHEDTQPSSNKILNVYLRAVTFFIWSTEETHKRLMRWNILFLFLVSYILAISLYWFYDTPPLSIDNRSSKLYGKYHDYTLQQISTIVCLIRCVSNFIPLISQLWQGSSLITFDFILFDHS